MQILTILIINIFVGAAIYLLISLKLERSASDFNQRRLRREMDEMIAEFNTAAEQNISLLENRISVMRRLLEQGGMLKGIDITVGLDDSSKPENPAAVPEKSDSSKITAKAAPQTSKQPVPELSVKQNFLNLANVLSNRFRNKVSSFLAPENIDAVVHPAQDTVLEVDTPRHELSSETISIEKELSEIPFQLMNAGETADDVEKDVVPAFDDDYLAELFLTSDDKYALIQNLISEGCPIESIERFSGMPIGEIKLVLNLQGQNFSI